MSQHTKTRIKLYDLWQREYEAARVHNSTDESNRIAFERLYEATGHRIKILPGNSNYTLVYAVVEPRGGPAVIGPFFPNDRLHRLSEIVRFLKDVDSRYTIYSDGVLE